MKKLLFNLVTGLISIAVILQSVVLPVAAENQETITYADIAKTAGNNEMKVYGISVENGNSTAKVKDTVPQTKGTTYYVDAINGNDENDGTSEDNAWKSIEKVNAVIYNAGDRILFKAGCVWETPEAPKTANSLSSEIDTDNDGRPEEFLAPKGSGTADNWIILGAYGEGDLPKLVGNANVNSVLTLKDQEYWDISNIDISNQDSAFNPNAGKDSENAKLMGNLRAIQIYGQSYSDDGKNLGGTLDGFRLHDLYIHDVGGHVYWGGSPTDRGYPGVFGNMGNDASKRTGGIVFEVWEPTTGKENPITFDNITISNNVICNTSFGGITVKQWSGQGHKEVTLDGFHSDAVDATNELWHRRFETATAENNYTNEDFHPHTNVYITDNYVSNSKTEYGCNTIRLQSVQGGLVEHNVCAGAGTCAIELDYLDDVVVQHNEVYGTRKKMGGADNNAIDTDSETTNCLIQYNYVYDNGDGFLLCGITFSTAVYRYNIIRNSGANDHYIGLYGDTGYNYVHNNLIYSANNPVSYIGTPGGKNVDKSNNPIYFDNNIFFNASSGSTSPALYQGKYSYYSNNSYYGKGVTVPSSDKNAVTEKMYFTGEFTDDLKAFDISEFSPLIDKGKSISYPDNFGGEFVDKYMTASDFYGNIADISNKPDIGISEYQFAAGMGIINGYVKDQYGNPAQDAEVKLGETDKTVLTSESGYYSFGEIPSGDYNVTVSKAQYSDSTAVTKTVVANEVTSANLNLGENLSDTGLLKGVVTGDGAVVANAKVVLTLNENVFETITNNLGEYTLEAPAGNDYTLSITKEGYKYKSQNNVVIQKGNVTTSDFVLQSNDYSNTVYFINDDFNDNETGAFSSNDMWTAYGTSATERTITIDENDENKYLHISKSSTTNGDVGVYNTQKANLGGIVTIEARVMRTTNGSGKYNQFGMYTFNESDWKGSGSSNNPIATLGFSGGNIFTHYKNESGGNSVYNLKEYEFNKWYTVRCIANLDLHTYDFYVDDMNTPVLSNYLLRNASKNIIDRFLLYTNSTNTGDICLDYFRVCTGTPYDYNDTELNNIMVNNEQAERISDTEYGITVSSATENVNILANAQSTFANVKVNNIAVLDKGTEINIDEGNNIITITVIAEDGTEKEYLLNIYRTTTDDERDAELDVVTVNNINAVKMSDMEYSVEVPKETTVLNILPRAFDSYYAVVKVNETAVDSNGLNLNMNDDKMEVTITVISKIGITKTYTLTITREDVKDNFDINIINGNISSGNSSVNIINNLGMDKTACIILAVYDNSNKLIYVDVQTKILNSGNDNLVTFENIVSETNCKAKVMLWENLKSMNAFSEAKAVN